jgi:hypothetical protein
MAFGGEETFLKAALVNVELEDLPLGDLVIPRNVFDVVAAGRQSRICYVSHL